MCGCSRRATICASRSKRRTKSGWFASSGWTALIATSRPDLGLDRAVDDAERALADLLEQPVAAERLALELEIGILAQDALVEPLELGRGIDAELVGEHARARARRRASASAGRPDAVEREHQLLPQPLAERQLAGERLELADHLAVATVARGRPRSAPRAPAGAARRAGRSRRRARPRPTRSAKAGPSPEAERLPQQVAPRARALPFAGLAPRAGGARTAPRRARRGSTCRT